MECQSPGQVQLVAAYGGDFRLAMSEKPATLPTT